MRIGTGFDVHRFGDESVESIAIGGMQVPYHRNILAHSDGDVILHAVCDAILGALALGDIGQHFPETDPQFHNVDSRELLRATAAKMTTKKYKLINADITLIAENPRVAKYVKAMRACIADDLATDVSAISIKATTTEKMGFIGRQEGLAAQAVVLLDD